MIDKRDDKDRTRIEVLNTFHILDSDREEVFESLVKLAALVCNTPMAILSLIDEKRQWFKASVGLDLRETDRAVSFCTHTIQQTLPFIVNDATQHPLFTKNPFVLNDPHIRFYAGVPLLASSQHAIGTLAVMDRVPREIDELQLAMISILAEMAMAQIELRRQHQVLKFLDAERESLNATLLRQSMHLRQAQLIAEVGSWELDVRTDRLTLSEEIYRIFGISQKYETEYFEAFLSFVHPEDRARVIKAKECALDGTCPFDIAHRIVRPNGVIRHVHQRAELRMDESETPVLTGTLQDVSSQHESNQQLRLLEICVARMNDILMITEARPYDEPGPRIVFVNDAFERYTEYSRAEVIGKSPRFLQGPKTAQKELHRLRRALELKVPVSTTVINYKKSGAEFWMEMEIVPVSDNGGSVTHFMAIQRDITEKKSHIEQLARKSRALQMLSRCNEALIKLDSEQALLQEICRLAVDVGGYRIAWVGYVQHDEARSVVPVAHAGAGTEIEELARVKLSWSAESPRGRGPGGRAIRERRAVVCPNVREDPSFSPWLELAEKHGYSGVICLPLQDKDSVIGVLSLHIEEVRAIDQEEVDLLQELADNLAYGIRYVRFQAERKQIEAAVFEVAASVSAGAGKAFFETLSQSMASVLGANTVLISQILPEQPNRARTICVLARGTVADNFEYDITSTPCENLIRSQESLVENTLGGQPAFPGMQIMHVHAYAGERLDDSLGRPIGFLLAMFDKPCERPQFIASTLRIFASRIASEIERLENYQKLEAQASLLDKARDAIIVCGTDLSISYWNKGAQRLYGWSQSEALGKNAGRLLGGGNDLTAQALSAVMGQGEWRGEVVQKRKDGSSLTIEAHWTLVKTEREQPYSILAINTDISHRKKAESEIELLAFYDPLTHLPNRRLLLDRLEHALSATYRNNRIGALLFIDLDNFKSLNDTLGHDKGDILLKQVARRLETCVRKNNTVARLGGDEFVIMLEDLSSNMAKAATKAEVIAEKVLQVFVGPFVLDGYEHYSTPSIGVAVFNRQIKNVDDLLKRADMAMYQAKAAGRNAIRFFDPEMQTIVSARVALESDFRRGLQQHDFFLHYQPQTDGEGKITGAEALLRWKNGSRCVRLRPLFLWRKKPV